MGAQATAPLLDTKYQWRVIAKGEVDFQARSETFVFRVDTLNPDVPANLSAVTIGVNQDRIVASWDRSADPVPSTGVAGDESGVDFYTVVVTRVVDQTEIQLGIVSDSDCDQVTNRCEFTSDELSSAQYAVKVGAVDRATNAGNFTPPVEVRAGPLGAPFNLIQLDPLNINNPKFQWQPPRQLPDPGDIVDGGIDSYEVLITGDLATADFPFKVPVEFTLFTDTDFFLVECINVTGDKMGSGGACTTAISPLDRIQLKVLGPLPFTLPDCRVSAVLDSFGSERLG